MQNASKVSTSVLPQKLFHSPPVQNAPLALSAMGFDRGRDYKTLTEALRSLPIELHLYNRREIISGLDIPDNVHFHGTVPDNTARFVEEGNVDAWRTALNDLSSKPEESRALESRAAQHVHEHLTYSHMWKSIEKAFKARGWIAQ